jgi:hypothetical protein
MKIQLYKIEQEYMVLADSIIENGGELTTEMETALMINREQLETKGNCYGYIIKDLESEIDVIDAEIKRLNEFKKSRVKTVDRLKENLSNAMQLFDIEKLESATLKIGFRKSESVEIENEALLSDEYVVTKVTTQPDKAKIKEAIKQGVEVMGAVLKQNKNLQIK